MPISDLSLFGTLRARMHYHQARQDVLAQNVAHADTPGYRPVDMEPFEMQMAAGSSFPVTLARTQAAHISGGTGGDGFRSGRMGPFEIRPQGNAVNLEDQMMKVAQNQIDHQAATALYGRSLGLLNMAFGRR
jgi:flagellar basal-body rod protein FlgB